MEQYWIEYPCGAKHMLKDQSVVWRVLTTFHRSRRGDIRVAVISSGGGTAPIAPDGEPAQCDLNCAKPGRHRRCETPHFFRGDDSMYRGLMVTCHGRIMKRHGDEVIDITKSMDGRCTEAEG